MMDVNNNSKGACAGQVMSANDDEYWEWADHNNGW